MRCVKTMVCAILILGTGVCSAVDGYLNVTKYDSANPSNLVANIYIIKAGPMGRMIEEVQMGDYWMQDAQSSIANWIWKASINIYGAGQFVNAGGSYKYMIRRDLNPDPYATNYVEVSRGEQIAEANSI